MKVFTPLATDITPASPAGGGLAVIALAGAALLVMKRR
jgi:MYXO-CTERM domain-containing protein